jgi:uncharacterized protein YndB with AHSA1/START domain
MATRVREETMAMKTEFVIEPGKQEIVATRVFDAPRELVFKMFTEPEHIKNWWGPRRYDTTIDKMDPKPGGVWRFIQSEKDSSAGGGMHAFHGVYHDVAAPDRIVQTFEYEGVPGHVSMETTTFEDLGSRTRLVQHAVFQSVADRDAMVASGMKDGQNESLDRIEELLAKA